MRRNVDEIRRKYYRSLGPDRIERRYSAVTSDRSTGGAATGRVIGGYAAVFNSPSLDLGGFREVLKPGCFAKSLRENPDVLSCYNHDENLVLGRTSAGNLEIREDAKGLYFEVTPPPTSLANDLAALVGSGVVTGASFSFVCESDAWYQNGDAVIRRVEECRLLEAGPVVNPAYPATVVGVVRSAGRLDPGFRAKWLVDLENQRRVRQFSRKGLRYVG